MKTLLTTIFVIVSVLFGRVAFGDTTVASPANLQFQCNSAGNQVTLTWNGVNGANNYLVRINDPSDDGSGSQWGWYDAGTTDVNADTVPQNSYTATVVAGKNYVWWVHAQINGVASAAAFGNFTCNPPQPPAPPASPTGLSYQCNSQGNQVTLSWNQVTGIDFYLLRLNDTSDDKNSSTQWGWYNSGTTDVNAEAFHKPCGPFLEFPI